MFFSQKEEVSAVDIEGEKEMMMGKEGFFHVKSSTKHRTSATSLTDFCQERITQFRDFLVVVTVNRFRRPHTFRALNV